ncbi:MAG: ArsR/SmtB family transcription factor [Gemmatimonadota bacterium]
MSREMRQGQDPDVLSWAALEEATSCLKAVAHPVRLRILELLLGGQYSVGELAELCEVDQAVASDHLGRLKDKGLLASEREGRQVFYRVAAPAVEGIVTCMRKNFGSSSPEDRCRG